LDLRSGDYEEHAILLCNYFNYIDLKLQTHCKSYIILGTGNLFLLITYLIFKVFLKEKLVMFYDFNQIMQNNMKFGMQVKANATISKRNKNHLNFVELLIKIQLP